MCSAAYVVELIQYAVLDCAVLQRLRTTQDHLPGESHAALRHARPCSVWLLQRDVKTCIRRHNNMPEVRQTTTTHPCSSRSCPDPTPATVMRKRNFSQAVSSDDDHLAIHLQSGFVVVMEWLLRAVSTVACGLPMGALTWDLSSLLIDGHPVSRDVLVAWLNAAYHLQLGTCFEAQDPDLTTTAAGLSAVLRFADAVGSRPGLLSACLSNLDQLQLHVQLAGTPVALIADGRAYCFDIKQQQWLYWFIPSSQCQTLQQAEDEAAKATFIQQVAEQTEELLWWAYRLQLPALADKMHAFVRYNTAFTNSLLRGHLNRVFTDRVLDAALGPNQMGRDAWINAVLCEPAACVTGSSLVSPLLVPESNEALQPFSNMAFKAKLARPYMGAAVGSVVDVTLSLFDNSIASMSGGGLVAQLQLGPHLNSGSRQALMGK